MVHDTNTGEPVTAGRRGRLLARLKGVIQRDVNVKEFEQHESRRDVQSEHGPAFIKQFKRSDPEDKAVPVVELQFK